MFFINVKVLLQDFVSLFYPEVCVHCREILVKNEKFLCTNCQLNLPYTYYHLHESNPVKGSFPYLGTLDFASSFLSFKKKGVAQSILHSIKYKGNYDLGIEMGVLMADVMKERIKKYDMILPVPIHPSKKRSRGYNQSTALAEGVSRVTGIPVREDIVERASISKSQTKKSRMDRWTTLSDAYTVVREDLLKDQSAILIDDVITTGATIGRFAEVVEGAGAKRCAILSLASGK